MLPRLSNGARGRFGRGIGCGWVQTCFLCIVAAAAAHDAMDFVVALMALVLVVLRLQGGQVIATGFVFVFPFHTNFVVFNLLVETGIFIRFVGGKFETGIFFTDTQNSKTRSKEWSKL